MLQQSKPTIYQTRQTAIDEFRTVCKNLEWDLTLDTKFKINGKLSINDVDTRLIIVSKPKNPNQGHYYYSVYLNEDYNTENDMYIIYLADHPGEFLILPMYLLIHYGVKFLKNEKIRPKFHIFHHNHAKFLLEKSSTKKIVRKPRKNCDIHWSENINIH